MIQAEPLVPVQNPSDVYMNNVFEEGTEVLGEQRIPTGDSSENTGGYVTLENDMQTELFVRIKNSSGFSDENTTNNSDGERDVQTKPTVIIGNSSENYDQ